MKAVKIILLILIITSLAGCASAISRSQNGNGHVYIGTERSFEDNGAVTILTAHYFFPALLITLPLSAIDIGLNIIADTIMLPIDLIVEPNDEKNKTSEDI